MEESHASGNDEELDDVVDELQKEEVTIPVETRADQSSGAQVVGVEKEASVPDDAVSDMQQGGETVLPQESSSSDAVLEGESIEAPDVVQGGLHDDFVEDAHVVVDPPAIPDFEMEDATQAATLSETHPEDAQDFVPLSELRKAKKDRRKGMWLVVSAAQSENEHVEESQEESDLRSMLIQGNYQDEWERRRRGSKCV